MDQRLSLVAIVSLAILLAACSTPPSPFSPQSRASPAATARPSPPATIDAFVPEAVRFVESHRGLRFKQPVKVDHLADQDFSRRIIELQRKDQAATEREAKLYRALGLVERGVDVEKAEERLLGAGVVGYYDPKTKELVVRGDTASPSIRHVVVHELTHALQDQWFGLDDSQREQTGDGALAYTALVEGDAVRIEREYIATLSSADRRQLANEGSAGPPSDVPPVLIELLTFPYVAGPSFISALTGARGQAGLDSAFRDRPAATSQILHPDRFLQGELPRTVAEPAAGGQTFEGGVLGEAELVVLLENAVRSGGLTRDQAHQAATGWAGDHYVAWTSGDSYCVRVRFATRNQADAAAMTGALQKFASAAPRATAEAADQPVLTSCG